MAESDKFRRYEFDGIVLDVPLYYDESVGRDIEQCPDFITNPIYTKDGYPLTLSFEDACEFVKASCTDGRIDCSDCDYYRQAVPGALFGVCQNEKKRRK